MAQHYTPIWDDWSEVTRELNAQEKGRLIDAIVAYDNGEDWQEQIKGNERYVFPGYKARIDRWQKTCDNRARTKDIDDDNLPQKKQNSAKITNDNKTHKEKVKDKDIYTTTTSACARADSSFGNVDLDPLILKLQQELNGLTDDHYAALEDYRQQLGDDLVSHAVDEAVGNGVRNWNYVEAILRGYTRDNVRNVGEAKARDEKHKKEKERASYQKPKLVRAQDYEQREYKESEMQEILGVYDIYKEEDAG